MYDTVAVLLDSIKIIWPRMSCSRCRRVLRRAETVVSKLSEREEVKHIKKVKTVNGYKNWSFEIAQKRWKVMYPSRKFLVTSISDISKVSEQLRSI